MCAHISGTHRERIESASSQYRIPPILIYTMYISREDEIIESLRLRRSLSENRTHS